MPKQKTRTPKKPEIPEAVREWFRSEGRRGGLIGGKIRLTTMTVKERKEHARRAGVASGLARTTKAAAPKKRAKR